MNSRIIFYLLVLCAVPAHGLMKHSQSITRRLPDCARTYFDQYHLPPTHLRQQFDAVFANPELQQKMNAVMVDYNDCAVFHLKQEGIKFHKGLVVSHEWGGRDFIFEHRALPSWIFKWPGSPKVEVELHTLGRVWRASQMKACAPEIKQRFNRVLTIPKKFAYPLPNRLYNLPEMIVAAQFLEYPPQQFHYEKIDASVLDFLYQKFGYLDIGYNKEGYLYSSNARARRHPYTDLAIIDTEPWEEPAPFQDQSNKPKREASNPMKIDR